MKHQKRNTFLAIGITLLAMTCNTDNTQQQAEQLLKTASTQFEKKQYEAALQSIDSLRRTYPTAIEARKQALTLQQNIEEARTQEQLAATDQALQKAQAAYEAARKISEAHHAAGTATAAELRKTTELRILRDSLQVEFDLQCGKIKYLRQKQQ